MFRGNIFPTYHETDAMRSKRVVLIMQWDQVGNHNHPGILEQSTDRPACTDFGASLQEVTHAEELSAYN